MMDTAIPDHNIAKHHRFTACMQQSLSQHASTFSGVLPLSAEIKNLGKCIHLRVCCSFNLATSVLHSAFMHCLHLRDGWYLQGLSCCCCGNVDPVSLIVSPTVDTYKQIHELSKYDKCCKRRTILLWPAPQNFHLR